MQQSKALALLKTGANVFLTGSAGTGKTYVLNEFIQYLRARNVPVAVTASTGIAATHMKGQTIHSWSGIGVKSSLNYGDLENMSTKRYLQKNMKDVKVLIIDEISMLHKNQLSMIDEVLKYFKKSLDPFGGIQVVLSGDFFQLPPVSRDNEPSRERMAFMSPSWIDAELNVCYLTKQFRQQSEEGSEMLTQILNEIRSAEVSQVAQDELYQAQFNTPPTSPVRLFTHNVDVDRINQEELDCLQDYPEKFKATVKGNPGLMEQLKKSILTSEELILKLQAKVMFVRNNHEAGYMNGTLGEVENFDEETGLPEIRISSGRKITAEHETWSIEDDQGKTLASFSQVPLRLAWAITVHKSQGMTLESAEIDLSKTFEKGQGYVALSRLKSMEGLKLLGFNDRALEVDELALKADRRFQELSAVAEKLDDAMLEKQQRTFLVSVGGLLNEEDIRKRMNKLQAKASKKNTIEQTLDLVKQKKTINQIAKERDLARSTIVQHLQRIKEYHPQTDIDIYRPDEALMEAVNNINYEVLKVDEPDAFSESGQIKLKYVYDALNSKFTYEEIRLALVFVEHE